MISVSMAKQIPPVRSGRSTAKKLPWVAHHQILTVLILAIAGFGIYAAAYTIQQNRQVAAERKQFMQAKVDLDDLYTKIVAAVGEPVQHKSLQYCSYTSVEIGQGERSCDVGHYLILTEDDATPLIEKSINILQYQGYTKFRNDEVGRNDTSAEHEIRTVAFRNKEALSCYLDFWSYDGGRLPDGVVSFQSNVRKGVFIDLECGGSAKAEYYPVLSD